MIETERLRLYPASRGEMERLIARESSAGLKAAYTEMLVGAEAHPGQWAWYALWMIESEDDAHIGELCFKGLNEDGSAEIGCGINEAYRAPRKR